ncbi:glutamine amidotransferase [Candidatus Magnetomorum sp. HK-1]|nr:glutamine amidotransferase [Candidatus Magnetomorum sp. HK-1]
MKIGVLALQGAFIEHQKILNQLQIETIDVRLPKDLHLIDGLIIPGGESTTIGKLAQAYSFMDPLKQFSIKKPVWGTCAGMIFIARRIDAINQTSLKLMDITVKRNAFGRQVDSFIAPLDIPALAVYSQATFPGIFIRAPEVISCGQSVEVLSCLSDGRIVAVKENHWLATSFHPELTEDLRLHQFFIDMISKSKS